MDKKHFDYADSNAIGKFDYLTNPWKMHIASSLIQTTFALILFAVVYVVFRFFFKIERPLRRPLLWVTWVVVTPIFYFMVLRVTLDLFFNAPSTTFDKELWLVNEKERATMVGDLMSKKILDAKSREQVIDLLGEPTDSVEYFQKSHPDLIYYVGPETGINGVDSEWLLIWFENDTVSKYLVMRD